MARVSLVLRSPRAPWSRTLTGAEAALAIPGGRERAHGMPSAPAHRNALRESFMGKDKGTWRATPGPRRDVDFPRRISLGSTFLPADLTGSYQCSWNEASVLVRSEAASRGLGVASTLRSYRMMAATSNRPKSTWSPWGLEYARTPGRYVFGTDPSDFALQVAALVEPGDRTLDLGCGEGRDSVFFAELGAVVTGIDLSADGVEKARRLARARGVRVGWRVGPMTDVLPAGPFDLVFSCGSIHYVPRKRRVELFTRLQAMTSPGGLHAHLVFTDSLVHEEKGEVVDYFKPGELDELFREWRIVTR